MQQQASAQSLIAGDVEITGTIKSAGSVRIDGKLDGELHCTGDAVIGKEASIKGNINVNSVTIEGTIQGNVSARDRIEMKSSARVTGDIKSKRLSVEDGVTFIGRSEVNPSGTPVTTGAVADTSPSTSSAPDKAKEPVLAQTVGRR